MKKIEFAGLSGSGKTTVMKMLEEHLQSQHVLFEKGDAAIKISNKKKINNILIFSIKNFKLTCFVLKEILKRNDKIFLLKRFFRIFYSQEYIRDKDFILFDEGFIYLGYYFQINFNNQNCLSEKKLEKYINKIPRPDYLIYVKTNVQTAMKRMMERGIIHSLVNHNDEQIKNYYFNSFMYFEAAAEELEKRGVKVIRICNDNDHSNLKEQLNKIFMDIEL
jgi:thymidylate kinase